MSQARWTHPVHDHMLVLGALDAHAQRLQRTQGGQAILTREKTGDVGYPSRDSSQHQSAMGDRFITRHRQLACDDTTWSYAILSHFLQHRAGVGAENAKQRGTLLQLFQSLRDMRILRMTFNIDEEHVIPLLPMRGTRFDTRHADPVV